MPPGWRNMLAKGLCSILELQSRTGSFAWLSVVPFLWTVDKGQRVNMSEKFRSISLFCRFLSLRCRMLHSEEALASFLEEYSRLDLAALQASEADKGLFDALFRAVVYYAPNFEGLPFYSTRPLSLSLCLPTLPQSFFNTSFLP